MAKMQNVTTTVVKQQTARYFQLLSENDRHLGSIWAEEFQLDESVPYGLKRAFFFTAGCLDTILYIKSFKFKVSEETGDVEVVLDRTAVL